jgi:hypothetical protein
LSGKFRDFHRFSFSEIACYFVCGFLTFFSLLVAVIDCNFLLSSLPSHIPIFSKRIFGGLCVCWNVVDTRGRRRRDDTQKLTAVKTFLKILIF